MIAKQNQKGGDGSTNVQAEQITMVVGIDEKRAREIYQEMNLQLREDYSKEALEIANLRVSEFENKLMPKMEEVDGALEAFTDPSFQLLLVEAQKTAASTERPADYDLLSELLIHRFEKGENRITRAGINRAVEIVDEVSDDALLGLTVFHAVSNFLPISGEIHKGLAVLNELFGKILYEELPTGNDWLDHLDILDTIRLNTYAKLKELPEFYAEQLSGYTDIGIEKDSANYTKALEILNNNDLSQDILVEHDLNSNFVRIAITNKNSIKSLRIQEEIIGENGETISISNPLPREQIEALTSVYNLYKQDDTLKQKNIKSFKEEWNNKRNLKIINDWWCNLNSSFKLTSVGKVLAHSNAQRCDKTLPPLN